MRKPTRLIIFIYVSGQQNQCRQFGRNLSQMNIALIMNEQSPRFLFLTEVKNSIYFKLITFTIQEYQMNKELLADLDDLDEDEDMQNDDQQNDSQMVDAGEGQNQEIKLEEYGVTNIAAQKHSRLLTLNRAKFLQHMTTINKKIDQILRSGEDVKLQYENKKQQMTEQINRCNMYASQILKETASISKYIKQIYNKKIPELQSIINNDGFYCRAIIQIQEPTPADTQKQLFSYLSPHQRISLRISISSPRDPLSKEDQKSVIQAAKIVIQLQNHYEALMIYLQTCMQVVAPNLCQLVGSAIASKLIAAAGGVDKLAAMPACNIQVMGGSRSAQVGFSQMERNHTGIFSQMDVVRDAPKKFQMQLVRMLATNTAKCARVDYLGTNSTLGAKLRDQMYQRFEKVQEQGGLSRIQKPLDIPDMQPKKKRGGKRHRKNKELYEMSELRKNQNRIKFNEAQQQIEEGVGLGMLKSGTSKLKINIKKQKLKVSKKMEQRANKKSGLQSTLNLSAHQGIELINPALKQQRSKSLGTQSYFAKQSGFRTIINSKMGK